MQPAGEIFALFLERLRVRRVWIEARMQQPFELENDETGTSPEEPPFTSEARELKARWTTRLREHLVVEILAGAKEAVAAAKVARRYREWCEEMEEMDALTIRERFLNVLLATFDPHSGYFSADSARAFDEMMGGEFFSIGLGLERLHERWEVGYLMPGGPAELSGAIARGDELEALADGDDPWQAVVKLRFRELAHMLRGQEGSRCRVALRGRDFDVEEQSDAALFPDTARFDAPVFYFGWYADNVTGPFRLPGFRFPPGAIALHIHSYSAATLRSETTGWAGPFVALGVAATVGNVYEPYLDLTHHPDKLLAALVAGRTWGEATYHALPVLSWQAVALGDPLFRPFAQSLSAQVANLPRRADPEAPYVVIREANFLARTGQPADALAWLARGARETPGLALSLRLAQERAKAGERTDAVRALQLFKFMRTLRVDEIGVAAEAGQLFESLGDPAAGVELYRALLAQSVLTADWRKLLLPRARDAALKAGMMVLHRQWSEELSSPP